MSNAWRGMTHLILETAQLYFVWPAQHCLYAVSVRVNNPSLQLEVHAMPAAYGPGETSGEACILRGP